MIFKMKWTLAILENLLVGDILTIWKSVGWVMYITSPTLFWFACGVTILTMHFQWRNPKVQLHISSSLSDLQSAIYPSVPIYYITLLVTNNYSAVRLVHIYIFLRISCRFQPTQIRSSLSFGAHFPLRLCIETILSSSSKWDHLRKLPNQFRSLFGFGWLIMMIRKCGVGVGKKPKN